MSQGWLKRSGVAYTLLGPGPPSNRFSEILRLAASARPESRMASVNAGDPQLYVGGGTINLAFQGQVPQPGDYARIHEEALNAARHGKATHTQFPPDAPVRLVQVTRSEDDPKDGGVGAGTVFLDVFAAGKSPHQVVENHAMAYVVPPNGRLIPDRHDFLDGVARTATNLVASLATYNAAVTAGTKSAYHGLEAITDLRTCLFSGGQFRHPETSVEDVARTIAMALDQALAASPSGLHLVEFESGQGEFSVVPQL